MGNEVRSTCPRLIGVADTDNLDIRTREETLLLESQVQAAARCSQIPIWRWILLSLWSIYVQDPNTFEVVSFRFRIKTFSNTVVAFLLK